MEALLLATCSKDIRMNRFFLLLVLLLTLSSPALAQSQAYVYVHGTWLSLSDEEAWHFTLTINAPSVDIGEAVGVIDYSAANCLARLLRINEDDHTVYLRQQATARCGEDKTLRLLYDHDSQQLAAHFDVGNRETLVMMKRIQTTGVEQAFNEGFDMGFGEGYETALQSVQAPIAHAPTTPQTLAVSPEELEIPHQASLPQALPTPVHNPYQQYVEQRFDFSTGVVACSDLRVVRNSIFAFYGYQFGEYGELGKFFASQAWYQPEQSRHSIDANNALASERVQQNAIATANVNAIVVAERACRSAPQEASPDPVRIAASQTLDIETNRSLERLWPWTSQRTANQADLDGLNCYQLRLMRNEIFARQGYAFERSSELGRFFYQQDWYAWVLPNETLQANNNAARNKVVHNEVALHNVNLIAAREQAMACR